MVYGCAMSLGSALRFRLDGPTRERLNAVARRSGVGMSLLIRQAVMDYVETAERTGQLPISLRVEENHGSVIGHQQNFTTGTRPEGKNPRYKIKRPKK